MPAERCPDRAWASANLDAYAYAYAYSAVGVGQPNLCAVIAWIKPSEQARRGGYLIHHRAIIAHPVRAVGGRFTALSINPSRVSSSPRFVKRSANL